MSVSRSSCGPECRYKLLKPEKDLTKNFDIDVTGILKTYLDEVTSLNPGTAVNFAEAALLIQGSTLIYGKKVELLHSLASDLMLELCGEKRKCAKKGDKKKRTCYKEKNVPEFCSLDDITASKNINLKEDALLPELQRIPRPPLSLIPLDSTEKGNVMLKNSKGEDLGNKMDYHLNICHIDKSGCLLLPGIQWDFSTEEMLEPLIIDNLSDTHNMENANDCSSGSLSPPNGDDITTSNLPIENGPNLKETLLGVMEPVSKKRSIRQASIPVDLPDEYNMENANDCGSHNSSPPDGDDIISSNLPIQNSLNLKVITGDFPLLPDDMEPVSKRRSIRLAAKRHKEQEAEMKRKEKEKQNEVESQNAGTGSQKPPLKLKRQIKRRGIHKLPRKLLKNLSCQLPEKMDTREEPTVSFNSRNYFPNDVDILPEVNQEDNNNDNLSPCDDIDIPPIEDPANNFSNDVGMHPEVNQEDNNNDNLSPCDDIDIPQIEDPANMPNISYENKAREMLDSYMMEVAQFSLKTELTEKVSKWEEKIKPVLDREKEKQPFNIHLYGTRIISNFEDNNQKQSINFNHICTGKSNWDVSRYFVTSLQLANDNNVEIETCKRRDGLDDVTLTLLSRKRHHEELKKFGHCQGEH